MPRYTPTTYLYTTSILPVEKLAVVERVTYLHKIVKSLVKHNFGIRLNRDTHSHRTRQADNIHCPDEHPALKQSAQDYNRHCSDLRQLDCIKTFKAKLKMKVMMNCSEYKVISENLIPFFSRNESVIFTCIFMTLFRLILIWFQGLYLRCERIPLR